MAHRFKHLTLPQEETWLDRAMKGFTYVFLGCLTLGLQAQWCYYLETIIKDFLSL